MVRLSHGSLVMWVEALGLHQVFQVPPVTSCLLYFIYHGHLYQERVQETLVGDVISQFNPVYSPVFCL